MSDEARTLWHDLGNHLNNILLQAAILQRQLTGEQQESAERIRVECRTAAEVIRRLRQQLDS